MNSIGMIMKTLFTVSVLALHLCASSTNGKELTEEKNIVVNTGFLQKFSVYIINNLPNGSSPLSAHCKSGNDDLGQRELRVNEYFSWPFRVNFLGTTLFFCGFQWGSKNAVFDVFDRKLADNYCGNPESGNKCVWTVEKDGFHLSNTFPPSDPPKFRDW